MNQPYTRNGKNDCVPELDKPDSIDIRLEASLGLNREVSNLGAKYDKK